MERTLLVLGLLFTLSVSSQKLQPLSIDAQIGIGLSAPYESADEIVNSGFFLQGELVLEMVSWVQIRPYAGMVLTSSKGEDLHGNPTNEKAETKAALLGVKGRLRAPIPWVAPYIEAGLGTSIGSFVTNTAFDDIDKSGITYHIPVSLGLELGKNHSVDLGLSYYFQPSVQQFAGAFAVGLSLPLQ